jgi:hypothetical protein
MPSTRVGLRRRFEQADGVRVLRAAEDRRRRSDLDDATEVHDRHAIGDVADDRKLVRDEDHRQTQTCDEIAQEVQNLGLDRDVQRAHRFVRDQKLGLNRQCPRDRNSLPLPAGKLPRIPLCDEAGQSHQFQH